MAIVIVMNRLAVMAVIAVLTALVAMVIIVCQSSRTPLPIGTIPRQRGSNPP